MKHYTLTMRLLSTAIVLSLLMLTSWSLWAESDMYNTLFSRKETDVALLSARTRDYLKLYTEGLTASLFGLADALTTIGNNKDAILDALLGCKNASPGKLLTVYCIFESGDALCTRSAAYEIFGNEQVQQCLQKAYSTSYRGARWTEPYISPLTLTRTFALYKPFTLEGQKAMVMMEINLDTMLSSILSVAKDSALTWTVVSRGGQLIATSDDFTRVPSDYKELSRGILENALPAIISLPATEKNCEIANTEYYFYRVNDACMDWTLFTFVKSSYFSEAVHPMVSKIVIIGILHLIVLTLLIAILSSRLTRPITQVAKQIKNSDNPLTLNFGTLPQKHNEIGVLTTSLMSMIDKVLLLQQQHEETLRQQRLLEIEVLQAQIHPHFFGNTLACIQTLVKEEKMKEAEDALVSLTKLMNYTVARTDSEVSLGDELRCAEAYVKLRQMRKNYSFDYQVFVPDDQLSHPVPRLFLQPIIENCIVHGFSGLAHRGMITVTGYEKDGRLFLCVDDNGLGETAERLNDVMNGSLSPSPHAHGIGVNNVFKRLELRNPGESGCLIERRVGGGVRVILNLGPRSNDSNSYSA